MANQRTITGLIALLLAAGSPPATASLATATTNLSQVYEMALANDARLAAVRASFDAAREMVPQSRARLLPNITVNGYTSSNDLSLLDSGPPSAGRKDSEWNSHGWSATLVQPLFNLESWFIFEQANILTEQARLNFAAEQQDLIMRVSEAYLNALRAEDNLQATEAEERAIKSQLEQTRRRLGVGLIAETDFYEARAAYDTTRTLRIRAANNVTVARENLRILTNQAIGDLAKLDSSMPIVQPEPFNVSEWVDASVSGNLQLRAARQRINAAETQLRANRSGHAPQLNVVATWQHNVDPTTAATFGSYRTNGKTDSSSYSLQLSMPIFSGGYTSSKVREAGFKLNESHQTVDLTLRQVSVNTRNLFNTVSADVDQVDANCQALVSARSSLKAVQAGYSVGARNIVDVLNGQQALYATQRSYLNSRYDFILNTLKLKQSAGSLSPQDISSLNHWIDGSVVAEEITPACGTS